MEPMHGAGWPHLRRAVAKAFGHNAFALAKAAAFSELLSLFPALLVAAALLAKAPTTETVRADVRGMLQDLLPQATMALAGRYFAPNGARGRRLLATAALVALFAAVGVMLSIMEGFRRAYRLPRGGFRFWQERLVALLLIPSALLPMVFATAFVVFGHQIELGMIAGADHVVRASVLVLWRAARWAVALAGGVGVCQVVFHFATPVRPPWARTLPGAVLATCGWFGSTMAYGWYVTRWADYGQVYGSLGAGIATMVWLYFVSIATLLGAEFNAQVYPMWDWEPATTLAEDDRREFPDGLNADAIPGWAKAGGEQGVGR